MNEPFWLDFEKLLAIARTLRNHGDQIQSEVCDILVGPERIKILRSMSYADYLQSFEWQFKKTQKLNDEPDCAICFSADALNVHHRTYERRGCEKFSDLITLCSECHAKFHNKLKDEKPPAKRRVASL